jgi:IS5 family transposase
MPQFIPFGETGLFDGFIQNIDAKSFETPLLRIGKLIDWNIFEATLMETVLKPAKGPGGRPRFHPLLMFKVLVLQKLHGLADDATSFQIADRHSFKAFLGLTPADAVPDGQTISDYRECLTKSGTFDKLFTLFLNHLQQRGLAMGRQGVMVDATFVPVPIQRNTREQNEIIKAGEIPDEFLTNPKLAAHKDCDGRWTKKGDVNYYGYKDHVKVDVESKLILDQVVTDASVHDSQAFAQLIQPEDTVVYADSAYSGEPIAKQLEAKGVAAQINEKGTRNHPLTPEQKESNRAKSKVRARVEHVFAQMTGTMRALWQRCIGRSRNEAGIKLTNLVYNLLRYEQIVRLRLLPLA